MRQIVLCVQAGLIGGALVGIGEALWVLSAAGSVSDYVALFYATVLYGLIGVGMGVGVGVGLAVLGALGVRPSEPVTWSLGFFGVVAPLGLVISRYIANKVLYAEAGVPMSGNLTLLAVFGGLTLVGLFLGRLLLTKTPLKVLLRAKGTAAAYAGLAVVSAAFSFAPTGAAGDGELAPVRPQTPEMAQKPDVLLIVVDTLRADALGAYAQPGATKTPALDALAADGVVFEQAHAQASWTRSSFASLYSSRVPSSHATALKASVLPDDVVTVAEVLQGAGWVTGGLPNNTNVTRSFNFHQGFDYFHYLAPNMPFWATESVYQLSMYSVLRKVGERMKGANKQVQDFYQPAEEALVQAQGFIEAQGDRRWMLMLHLMEPHDPYFEHPYNGVGFARAEHEVPDPAKTDYLKATYAGEVSYMDEQLAGFFAWLKSSGRYDNTLVVVTADHGEEFNEHGGWWHGTTLYQEQIHVPLLVKLPGQELAGARAPWTVRSIDVAPTLAAAVGTAPDGSWQGVDLLDEGSRGALRVMMAPPEPVAAEGEAPAPAGEGEAPEGVVPAEAPVAPRLDLNTLNRTVLSEEDFEGNQLSAVVQGGVKYIVANEGNPRGLPTEALYDLQVDPVEQQNLAGQDGSRQTAMSAILEAELKRAKGQAVQAQEGEIDAATAEQMRALGYME